MPQEHSRKSRGEVWLYHSRSESFTQSLREMVGWTSSEVTLLAFFSREHLTNHKLYAIILAIVSIQEWSANLLFASISDAFGSTNLFVPLLPFTLLF
jgi:hypothetical protein